MTKNVPYFDTHITGGFRIRNARKKFVCALCKQTFPPDGNSMRFDYLIDTREEAVNIVARQTYCLPCAQLTLMQTAENLQSAIDDPDSFRLISKL